MWNLLNLRLVDVCHEDNWVCFFPFFLFCLPFRWAWCCHIFRWHRERCSLFTSVYLFFFSFPERFWPASSFHLFGLGLSPFSSACEPSSLFAVVISCWLRSTNDFDSFRSVFTFGFGFRLFRFLPQYFLLLMGSLTFYCFTPGFPAFFLSMWEELCLPQRFCLFFLFSPNRHTDISFPHPFCSEPPSVFRFDRRVFVFMIFAILHTTSLKFFFWTSQPSAVCPFRLFRSKPSTHRCFMSLFGEPFTIPYYNLSSIDIDIYSWDRYLFFTLCSLRELVYLFCFTLSFKRSLATTVWSFPHSLTFF